MTRLRLAALTAVAGAGFIGGCCGIGQGQLLDRLSCRRHSDCECSRLGTGPVMGTMTGHVIGEGPILEDPGTCTAPPLSSLPPVGGMPSLPPIGGMPQPGPMLTPVPGTSTEPPIAQPTPAGPGGAMSRRNVK
jgi:hypothetical protein